MIITIGRQFGSGGRAIAKQLAAHFGFEFYDKDLIKRAAKESGYSEEIIRSHDERPTNSFLYNLVMDTYSHGFAAASFVDLPLAHKVFLAQFDTIKKIAAERSCVLLGRCSDYALAGMPGKLDVFICANEDARVLRIVEHDGISREKAKDIMAKSDKEREAYYNYYTDKKWGAAESYDICLNTSVLGIENTGRVLIGYVEQFKAKLGEQQ